MSPRQFNLADLFEVVVDAVPDRLALVAGDRRLTYRQLDQRANRFAHFLSDRGIEAGAHVGILAYNCAEWAEAMVGCYKARTVPVNLNYRYVASELPLRHRERRPRGAGVRARPLGPGDGGARWSDTDRPPPSGGHRGRFPSIRNEAPAIGFETAMASAAPDASSGTDRPTTSTCSTPEVPPVCPRG